MPNVQVVLRHPDTLAAPSCNPDDAHDWDGGLTEGSMVEHRSGARERWEWTCRTCGCTARAITTDREGRFDVATDPALAARLRLHLGERTLLDRDADPGGAPLDVRLPARAALRVRARAGDRASMLRVTIDGTRVLLDDEPAGPGATLEAATWDLEEGPHRVWWRTGSPLRPDDWHAGTALVDVREGTTVDLAADGAPAARVVFVLRDPLGAPVPWAPDLALSWCGQRLDRRHDLESALEPVAGCAGGWRLWHLPTTAGLELEVRIGWGEPSRVPLTLEAARETGPLDVTVSRREPGQR